jgi:hypothetical protein
MVSYIDLVVVAHPECRDPLRAIVGDYLRGTVAHWQTVYGQVVSELTRLHLESAQNRSMCRTDRCAMWPDSWLASSNDSYHEQFGHHRNSWRQFDAVIVQLQRRTQIIVEESCHDLDTADGIRQWRESMMPFLIDLQCFSCGSMYQQRVTIFSHDPGAPECECDPCVDIVATFHTQMYTDYMATLSPRSREMEEGTEQGRRYRLKKRRRIPELCESRRRQRISQTGASHDG